MFSVELKTKDGGGAGLDCVVVTAVSKQLDGCFETKSTVESRSAELTRMWRTVGKT